MNVLNIETSEIFTVNLFVKEKGVQKAVPESTLSAMVSKWLNQWEWDDKHGFYKTFCDGFDDMVYWLEVNAAKKLGIQEDDLHIQCYCAAYWSPTRGIYNL